LGKLNPREYVTAFTQIQSFAGKIAGYLSTEKPMKKLFLFFSLLMAIGLVGCLPQEQATPASTATSESRPAPTVVLSVPTESAFLPDSGCTVITKKPTPGPTAESIFPPVSKTDWVKGPDNAKVTIIEYSDFQ
jgi:protein-disulfide isomerase